MAAICYRELDLFLLRDGQWKWKLKSFIIWENITKNCVPIIKDEMTSSHLKRGSFIKLYYWILRNLWIDFSESLSKRIFFIFLIDGKIISVFYYKNTQTWKRKVTSLDRPEKLCGVLGQLPVFKGTAPQLKPRGHEFDSHWGQISFSPYNDAQTNK